jgi:peptide/nickel transport system permease protein
VRRERRGLGWGFWLAVAWIVLVVGAALLAGVLPLPSYKATLTGPPQAGPSPHHLLGTDGLGRDVLSRVIFASRVSLGVGLGAVALGLVFGATLGLVAGFYRGVSGTVIMALGDIALAFPALVFAMAVVAFAGPNVRNVLLVLGVLGVPAWIRLVRGATLSYGSREFVLAARALGARDRTILGREIVPNVALPVASYAFIAMGVVIVAEGALAFLGLSVQAPTPTWGGMINEARNNMDTAPHVVLAPSLAMFLTVLAFNLVGDRLRERADIREGGLEPTRLLVTEDVLTGTSAAAPVRTRPAEPPLLDVEDLKTHFHTARGTVRAVDGVSLGLERGRTLAIVGESGSGKTMLIRSILGLLPGGGVTRGGRAYLGDVELTALDAAGMRGLLGTRMAAVFQDPTSALNPVRTIGAQLTEPLRVHKRLGRAAARDAAVRLLASVHIPEPRRVLRRYPHELSGGMRQRVTIAMALSCGPDLLFADEPTTSLDVTVQDQVLRLLDEQRRERDMGLVLVSHDLAVVADWADEVIVMYAGRVVERGPASALFTSPRMPYTEALLRAVPDITADGHTRLLAIEGRPPDLADPPPGCRFHPRCPYARERCAAEEPPLVSNTDPRHTYACWYPLDDTAAPADPGTEGAVEGGGHGR